MGDIVIAKDLDDKFSAAADAYLLQWKAHGHPLTCARDWREERFLVIGVAAALFAVGAARFLSVYGDGDAAPHPAAAALAVATPAPARADCVCPDSRCGSFSGNMAKDQGAPSEGHAGP